MALTNLQQAPAVETERRDSAWLPALIFVFLAVLTIIVFRQQLFAHWTFPWDFLGPHSTQPAFVAAMVGNGHIPTWSPYVASGFPVAVDPQVGAYFPGWWLLGLLHIPATLGVLTAVQVVHVLFGSLGVLVLARVRGLGWQWAALAAAAYLFFGGFYGESEHADITRGFSYLPWVLWSLTPPRDTTKRWSRLIALPLLAWIVASGAYPGQVVSFGIIGLAYLGCTLYRESHLWRRHWMPLTMAVVASASVSLAVLLPYIHAQQAGELYRVYEPTVAVRAKESLSPLDLLGLYLNNFAWTYDGTITSWAVGIPVLVGLFCLRCVTLARQAPLVVSGLLALALAMTPKIHFVGEVMVALRPLFPSRFPAADYKAAAAVAMVILAADSWSVVASRRTRATWRAGTAAVLLLVGALLAPSTHAQPTRALWLVVVVIVACTALALLRPPARWLAVALVVLIVTDGMRIVYDYSFKGQESPWRVTPAEALPFQARNQLIRELPKRLAQAPPSRPSRVPSAAPLSIAPTGTNWDNAGWIADGYHLTDYDSTIERVRWEAEKSAQWSALLLDPWHGYTFSCAKVGCSNGSVRLPPVKDWPASRFVQTISYELEHIVYKVHVSEPVLLVENELAITGWQANTRRVKIVHAGIPLRAWRLSPGTYEFTASYRQPETSLQELAALCAFLCWLACCVLALPHGLIRPFSRGRDTASAAPAVH